MNAEWIALPLAVQVTEVESHFDGISFEDEFNRYSLPESEAHWVRTEPYYWGLAIYTKLAGANTVLEIGTLFGGSAIALAKYAMRVIAADVDLSRAEATNLFRHNIEPFKCDSIEACLSIPLDGIDLVFVDIDHSGRIEQLLHERFLREYGGVVFYDDISMNIGIQGFWNRIGCEKVATNWHHTGFGAVRYQN